MTVGTRGTIDEYGRRKCQQNIRGGGGTTGCRIITSAVSIFFIARLMVNGKNVEAFGKGFFGLVLPQVQQGGCQSLLRGKRIGF